MTKLLNLLLKHHKVLLALIAINIAFAMDDNDFDREADIQHCINLMEEIKGAENFEEKIKELSQEYHVQIRPWGYLFNISESKNKKYASQMGIVLPSKNPKNKYKAEKVAVEKVASEEEYTATSLHFHKNKMEMLELLDGELYILGNIPFAELDNNLDNLFYHFMNGSCKVVPPYTITSIMNGSDKVGFFYEESWAVDKTKLDTSTVESDLKRIVRGEKLRIERKEKDPKYPGHHMYKLIFPRKFPYNKQGCVYSKNVRY